MLVSINSLTKSYGENLLFSDVSFDIMSQDVIGLIGDNGSGKTTLFKMISGEETADKGSVVRKSGVTVGVLAQHACSGSEKNAYDETLSVFDNLLKTETELSEVNLRLETSADKSLIEKQHMLQELFEQNGGLTFRSRTRSALIGLGFSENELTLPVSSLSGGQRSKVELCKLLLSKPDVMLLDEPTNHLDIDAIEWLDGYIKTCKSAVVIISHDRFFLDRVANKIAEISGHKLYMCQGNYSKYCEVREIRRKTVQSNYDNTMREVERIEHIIEQQRRWNREKNIKTAENKQKMIDRLMANLEIPESERDKMTLSFSANTRSGDEVLSAENLKTAFDEEVLYKDISLEVRRGDRIFIIGPNGCGKTTLLKQLFDRTKVKYGVGVKSGLFDQHQSDLNLNNTVFGELRDTYPTLGDAVLRGALALFMFKGEDVFKVLGTLSGGERARVALCKLMLRHDNLLFLDEPTNHLDLESREILEEALSDYDGTLICVSHDRYFINRLAQSVLYFENKTAKYIKGNYDSYVLVRQPEIVEKTVKNRPSAAKNEYLNRKKNAAEERKLRAALSKCEKAISETENLIEQKNCEIQSPEVSSDYVKVTELGTEISVLEEKLLSLMEEWESLSERVNET